MLAELKVLFVKEVRFMKYKCVDELFSIMMEDNTCLESHLARIRSAYSILVDV
jgi:hypothetical protein